MNQTHKEKVEELKKNIKIIKEAVKKQKQSNRQIQDKLFRSYDQIKKKQAESKRRDQKNQGLLLEIRVLRDALIAEKNQRAQLQDKLSAIIKQQQASTQGSKISMANYFGLKSFFQK